MSRVIVIDLMGEDEAVEKPAGKEKEPCEGCTNCNCGKKAQGYDIGLGLLRYEDDSMMLAPAAYKVLWEKWPGK